jgi:hypothetical protein
MRSLTLKQVPDDLYKEILAEQEKIKIKKDVRVYSIDQTVYHMLKELLSLRKQPAQ